MKPPSKDHREPEKNEQALRALEMLDAENMVALARRRYANDFPNPQHHGCPLQGEIAKSVSRSQAPDQCLLAHLFECSECFLEYRNALAGSPVENTGRNTELRFHSVWGFSAALIAVTLFIGGIWIYRRSTPDKLENIDARNARATTTIPKPEGKLDRGERAARNQSTDKSVAILSEKRVQGDQMQLANLPQIRTVRIDLDNHPNLRSPRDAGTAGKADGRGVKEELILLAASRARLLLRLPESGVAGDYTISLVDAYDRILVSRHAVSPDGAWLRVMFDLRKIPPEKYRLRLSREGEAPAYYNVMIKKG